MIIPSLKFIYDRMHRTSKNKKGTVDLRITYQRRQKFIATGVRVLPHQWDAKKEQVVSFDSAEYNTILADIKARVLRIISNMAKSGNIDIDAIPNLLKQESVDITFIDYFYKRMEGRKVAENTHRSHVTTYNKLVEYGKIKYFSDITQRNIRNFGEWLHKYKWKERDKYGNVVERMYSQASIYKLTSNLSCFISDAVVDGYVKENPYITKRMNESRGGTRIDQYLTKDEVEKLEQAQMPTPAMAETKDLFLLQCYTGLSYADLMTYDFTQHKDKEGYELASGKRKKTGVEFFFVLQEKGREILRKYDYMIPKLSNQKYNWKLKTVAEIAMVDKQLTTHMGRRTAGSIWLNAGIPIEVVSKCLGHSSILMTQKAYAKILDNTIIEAFEKVNKK